MKGTIHWVARETAVQAECRLYENLVDEEKGKLNADGTLKSESQLPDCLKGMLCGAILKGCQGLRQFPVCEKRLFLRRLQRQRAGVSGIQPYRISEELLQDYKIE